MCKISEVCPECEEKLSPYFEIIKDKEIVFLQCDNCGYRIDVEEKDLPNDYFNVKSSNSNLKPLFVKK